MLSIDHMLNSGTRNNVIAGGEIPNDSSGSESSESFSSSSSGRRGTSLVPRTRLVFHLDPVNPVTIYPLSGSLNSVCSPTFQAEASCRSCQSCEDPSCQ